MLGDSQAALDELALLQPASQGQPEVAEFTWTLHAHRQDWARAHLVADALVRNFPDRSFGWVHRAYALRRMAGGSIPLAWEALHPAVDLFPKEHIIPYNLACYAAQLGRLDEAWDWLQRAFAIGKKTAILKMALADPDLEALWPRLGKST